MKKQNVIACVVTSQRVLFGFRRDISPKKKQKEEKGKTINNAI